ncbi:MAG TPA: alpha-hydroxy-acid oxidizing protein [Xanthobacteraceae bacterium]|nr:alpha-hydroxy-acid oxidizing protein [Xanthobacteraceae bacterium]
MSVVSPHQTIAAEALRDTSSGARPPGSASPPATSADRPLAAAKRSQTAVPRRLRRYLSLADFEKTARRRLPRMIYGFIAGAVETDAALRDNRRAFDEYGFVPRVLNDVSSRSQMTTLFGMTYAAPFGVAAHGARAAGGDARDRNFGRSIARDV